MSVEGLHFSALKSQAAASNLSSNIYIPDNQTTKSIMLSYKHLTYLSKPMISSLSSYSYTYLNISY